MQKCSGYLVGLDYVLNLCGLHLWFQNWNFLYILALTFRQKFGRRFWHLASMLYYTWGYNKSKPKRHLWSVFCIIYSCKKSWYSLRRQEKCLEAGVRQFWGIKGLFFNRRVLTQWTLGCLGSSSFDICSQKGI